MGDGAQGTKDGEGASGLPDVEVYGPARRLLDAGGALVLERRPAPVLGIAPRQSLHLGEGHDELDERVALLREEIARLEADKVKKQAQRSAADQFFKR